MSMLYLISLATLVTLSKGGVSYCYDEEECANSVYTTTMYCYGYRSCHYSNITAGTNQCYGYYGCSHTRIDGANIYCYGDYGCYYGYFDSTTVKCFGSHSCDYGDVQCTNIYCTGDYSCANLIGFIDTNINCYGNYGCYNSVFDVDTRIYCDGDYGCAEAYLTMDGTAARNAYFDGNYGGHKLTLDLSDDITNAVNLYGNGYYGLSNATLKLAEGNKINLYMYGYHAGFGLTVECGADTTCNINCYGYSCYSMGVYCDDDATCNINCYFQAEGDYCPEEQTLTSSSSKRRILETQHLDKKADHKVRSKNIKLLSGKTAKDLNYEDSQIKLVEAEIQKLNDKNVAKHNIILSKIEFDENYVKGIEDIRKQMLDELEKDKKENELVQQQMKNGKNR